MDIKKFAKRTISVFSAFALCILVLANPVLVDATIYNPADYIIDSYYQGTEQFVTIQLPINSNSVNHSFYSHGVWEYSKPGYSVEFTVNQGFGYDVYFTFSHLNISDFPDSTRLEVDVYIDLFDDTVNPDHMTGVSMQPWVQFYDNNLKWVSAMKTYPTNNVNLNGYTKLTALLDKDTNLASVGVKVSGFSTDHVPLGTEVVLSMTSLKLTFSVSSLLDLQKNQDKTNELLEELLNGTPEQNEEANAAVGGLNNSIGGLNQAGDALSSLNKPSAGDIDVSIGALVPQAGVTSLTRPILMLWDNPTLLAIITLVLSVCLLSWVFFGKKG